MKAKAPFAAMLIGILAGCASKEPLATVPSVDVKRYSGQWHEIARYPNFFQRNCAGGVMALYTPSPDGSITILNSCRRANGGRDTARGVATIVPGSGNAKLKVRFGGPFAGDYWIIALDPEYRWVLVGHPSRKFLWILSRTPTMPGELYERIVSLAVKNGYDAAKIMKTPP